MQDLYTPLVGIENPHDKISLLNRKEVVEKAVDTVICRLLEGGDGAAVAINHRFMFAQYINII